MSSNRRFITSTFSPSMVDEVARSCRLMFVMHTLSASTSVMSHIPERTSDSAHQLPTPPTPNTMTRLDITWLNVSSPSRSLNRLNRESVIIYIEVPLIAFGCYIMMFGIAFMECAVDDNMSVGHCGNASHFVRYENDSGVFSQLGYDFVKTIFKVLVDIT